MFDGHAPGDIDAYPWRDIELYMAARPGIVAADHPFAEEP